MYREGGNGSQEPVISIRDVGKCYHMYSSPQERLKQMVFSKLPLAKKQRYKEFWALKGVSLDVLRGETVGIIGRNGSGKSTLLQMIAGTLAPTHGTLAVKGRISALLELGSGFNPEFTGRENIFLSGSILGIPKKEMEKRFAEIADFADIGDFIDQPVKTYSSGMHARLAFAVAISVDPEILIVDEILAVGDAAFQAKCHRAFHRIRDKGCTVLMVTQDPYLVRSFCTTALYLRKGQVVAYGDPAVVTERYLLEIEAAQMRDQRTEDSEVQANDVREEQANVSAFEGDIPLYRIEEVQLLNQQGEETDVIRSGETVRLRFRYKKLSNGSDKVVFVFSLYRHDDLYICGNTTLMDGHAPSEAQREGLVEVEFPDFRLLSGRYKWRVAVDDERGHGIHAERYTEEFRVVDQLEAVGLFNLERRWVIYE